MRRFAPISSLQKCLASASARITRPGPTPGPTPAARATVDEQDLLGRKPVNLDTPELQRFLAGKVVLVTGAGGSIGSEICRQSMKFCPRRLVLVERAENALFEIDRELRQQWLGADIRPCVADICDAVRIGEVFNTERPDVVFHAAAHKHVPMMELNPGEAVKNNVFGTKTVADAARAARCDAFVLVSTDKAVNPTNVMGATKRCAELYVQSLNAEKPAARSQKPPHSGSWLVASGSSSARFVAVRFGNVLGSSGSVVPIFRQQIAMGGPVTVTHPDMRRYFMTIPEASQLVMQAGAIGKGGEIFVLDMGEPIRILELAEEMIRRSGLRIGEDIVIRFSGIRPGEKLYEELANDDEQTRSTSHAKIRVWELPPAREAQVMRMLDLLSAVTDAPRDEVVRALRQVVVEYRPEVTDASASEQPEPPPLRLVPAHRAA
ncbi:MAG TPA: nucleoside-diphosphate sugar epimerase/dehydratase [Tepidisphaeraceae bacterium]|nr:nucleoside-diphosphate sugar epimerase/dehydratase [Tepidisphaeraceae bacterium]